MTASWPIRAGITALCAAAVGAICAVTLPADAAEGDIGIVDRLRTPVVLTGV